MRKYKKRLQKKWLKRVAVGMSVGDEIPRFYTQRALRIMQWFYDYQYLVIFRPWWYEQDWGKLDFKEEMIRHYKSSDQKFREFSGFDSNELAALIDREREGKSKRSRKPRKEKPKPTLRKLKSPQLYEIRMMSGERQHVKGEKAFTHQDHEFFIYHNGYQWVVTDTTMGAAIAYNHSYKKAVEVAKERIEKNYSTYIDMVNKQLAGER